MLRGSPGLPGAGWAPEMPGIEEPLMEVWAKLELWCSPYSARLTAAGDVGFLELLTDLLILDTIQPTLSFHISLVLLSSHGEVA